MKKIFTTSFFCLIAITMFSQFVQDYLKAADRYFSKGDYASAATYYEKYFGKDDKVSASFNPYTPQGSSKKTVTAVSSREQALWNLAESYRLLNYPAKAEPLYKQVVEQSKDKFPLAAFHHSTMLRALARYSEAEAGFQSFLETYPTQDEYRRSAEREIQNLRFIQKELAKKDLKYYSVNKTGAGMNTAGATYALAPLGSNMVLFTSTRPLDSTSKNKDYKNRLYMASWTADGFNNIEQLSLQQPENMEQGVATSTPDGNTIFFSRWSVNTKEKSSAIYSSTKNAMGWTEPAKLGEAINLTGSNNQQPFVTPDGKYLLFSSDRTGGQGGYDIWYAELSGGQPGLPVNAGASINTSGDEQAPSYHAASGSLVFSSNGRIGMGGYDLFQSRGTIGNWSAVENLGYPVNSIKDDMYFLSTGSAKNILEKVWLSSDRDAACCLELFSLQKIRPLRQISGTIVSCDGSKLLPGATITITDATSNQTVFSGTVGADGVYRFTMEDYQPMVIQATAQGFLPGNLKVNLPADLEAESMDIAKLCLVPEPPKVNESFVVENVFYEYDKSQIKPESFPALDQIVKMLNTYPNLVIEISGHTDSKGSDIYNQRLSEARAKAVVDYLVSNGISRSRLSARGYGESMPVAPNENPDGSDNPEGREKNRRTEFKVIKN